MLAVAMQVKKGFNLKLFLVHNLVQFDICKTLKPHLPWLLFTYIHLITLISIKSSCLHAGLHADKKPTRDNLELHYTADFWLAGPV